MENVRNLPQELVEEILTRLPCKSLIRFKCVCKHWNALFHKDTKFLSRHVSHFLKNQNSAANDVLLKLTSHIEPVTFLELEIYKLFSLSATGNIGMETPIPTSKYFSRRYRICGHSNGIVCLLSRAMILLYNPLTREIRKLPPCTAAEQFEPYPFTVGMGYDSFTDDFKVISIRKRRNATDYYATVTFVEQYTLSTDSWTVMPNTNVDELFRFDRDSFAMCFKRTFYWWARCRGNSTYVILALNMDDGVFQLVPKPAGVDIGKHHAKSLTVWNDSISLVVCCSNHIPTDVDIWVMGGFGSWTLMRTIEHLREVPKPLVFWKGNELLMDMMSGRKIKSYNVDTEEVKDLPIEFIGGNSYFQAVNYVASLVPLKGEIYPFGKTA